MSVFPDRSYYLKTRSRRFGTARKRRNRRRWKRSHCRWSRLKLRELNSEKEITFKSIRNQQQLDQNKSTAIHYDHTISEGTSLFDRMTFFRNLGVVLLNNIHSKRRLLGCSTGGCSTIQIEQKLFDDLKSWDVRLRLCSTENWQLSNIKLIALNQKDDYVRLILISTLKMDNCRT